MAKKKKEGGGLFFTSFSLFSKPVDCSCDCPAGYRAYGDEGAERPLCRVKNQNHRRVHRGLLKCYKRDKVFNADLVGAYNILLKAKVISPKPRSMQSRGNAPETGRRAKPGRSWECSPKTPQNPRTLGRRGGQ